jgi:acetolactate synthase-1/2/3 large subunit
MSQSQPAGVKTKSGAEIVVGALERRNIKWVFGIPGAKIDSVFNALADSSIQTITCRHEQNAAFIAGGIGRMTGRAGVAIATSGCAWPCDCRSACRLQRQSNALRKHG